MFIGRRAIFPFLTLLLAALLGGPAVACDSQSAPPPSEPAAVATARPVTPAASPVTATIIPDSAGAEPAAAGKTPTAMPAPVTVPVPALTLTPPATTAAAAALPPPAPAVAAPTVVAFPAPPERDLYQLARELRLPPGVAAVEPVVNPKPVSYAAGRRDEFWMVNLRDLEVYQSGFELRLVTDNAYWYVEEGLRVNQESLERAAAVYEQRIYPRVRAAFGTEWRPGVDNDPHLTILHGAIAGAAGYYSSGDEYPEEVHPRSNEREMIYINGQVLRAGSRGHLTVLAHELQHAIHWNYDASEDTWVNEGLAELAVTAAGYEGVQEWFMRNPYVSLVHWPLDDENIGAYYGGASLFMHYLAEHYGTADGQGGKTLRPLVTEPADGIAGIDAYLAGAGYEVGFYDVFRDWVAANFLDAGDGGIYGYGDLSVGVWERAIVNAPGTVERAAAQYGADYLLIGPELMGETLRLTFTGAGENRLLPAEVGEGGCWWSNYGDSIMSTLTRPVDLRGVDNAVLTYQAWHRIEEDWDYGYLQVSTDGGQRWTILETPYTSEDNPIGGAYGPGYTGDSGGWIEEAVDLSGYGGREILMRFQYVTDDALNDVGLCLRDIGIAAAGVAAGDDSEWIADGFIRIDNRVAQQYIVQVLQKGEENRVTRIELAADGRGGLTGTATVPPYAGLRRMMVAVTPVAAGTREPAGYSLTVAVGE